MKNVKIVVPLVLGSWLIPAGCSVGPAALRVSQAEYNKAVQYTISEQLLLNLVRLRYRDPALFLQITNVSTQFEIARSAEISATLNENVGPDEITPDVLGIGGHFTYAERPTVSITPLQGDEFVTRMLKTFDLDTIALLHTAGWGLDRIMILTVSRMNHLGNAVNASSPTPDDAPVYEDFVRVTHLLRQLQRRDGLFIGYTMREAEMSDRLPASAITGEAALAAVREGYALRRVGEDYVLRTGRLVMQLTVTGDARRSAEWAEICQLLRIDTQAAQYEIEVGVSPISEHRQGDLPTTITIEPRSLMGTLFLLSHAVQAPREHRDAGIVTVTRDAQGLEIDWAEVSFNRLQVHSQRLPPSNAAVAVKYRGYWFYIQDDDRNSKSTFMLLNYLFALQAGEAQTKGPVLTLPIG